MPPIEPLREGDPTAIGPYRLAGRLGAGGQGVVYLGQGPDGRPVAVKVLREGLAGERFAKEIEAARRVEPFCIAQVLDASPVGRPYIVTEYIEGPSLQQAGRHHGADLQRLAVATATALAAIHQAGIVHRDFKPANVLLGRGGPRVIDFGIARSVAAGATVSSGVMGTPAYMAPEQLAGEAVGPAADVFAWASVIVFAATGSPPFGEDTLPAVINRILHNEPQLGDLAPPLRGVVLECLAKDPARRPSMREVLLRLLGAPSQETQPGRRASPSRRGGVLWAVAGASGMAVVMVVVAVVWGVTNGWGGPGGTEALAITSGPASTPSASRSKKPRPSKKHTTRPATTRKPGTGPTSAGPTTNPTTTMPTTTKPATTKPETGGFSIVSIRVQGARKANTQDCEIGESNTFGLVEGTRLRTTFHYQWVLDGKVVDRSEAVIADTHTHQVVGPLVKPNGPHTITLRLTSPVAVAKSVKFTICPTGTE
ncbi:serine/threonine protein kinase [Nonomuraea sp. NBC_01738]|uniref:serine/threonine-protein kinase n=1 Tax=Nonomuraea sp. NBC_01738 TaxID=2976003 RepID=UPI002E13C777|nr:serine/threonine protein kinase [Nonomuraea sp. NBC_01738]